MTATADSQAVQVSRDSTTASDSITVASWTLASRVTGVVKIAAIGAVFGPTYLGNAYQFTNSLPNLIYFGLLAGSLFSSLLVPALVQHIDCGNRAAFERVAGGFLGVTLVAMLALIPVAIILGPFALHAAAGAHASGSAQESVGRYLIVLFIPQVFLYGVVGTAAAVMNAHRKFALAAAAPAVENMATIAVLGACAALYGTGVDVRSVQTGELLLLGLGTTGAVALHAGTQWWGARRVGVLLVPRAGWHDHEVRAIVRRALPSLAQAGLMAAQVITLLVLANRVPGGVVAFQIALNFYFLAIALGATPVALSLLPSLARFHVEGDVARFRETLSGGFALGLFVAIPAAVAYAGLSLPLAQAVSFGRMGTPDGIALVSSALAALSLAVIGQTAFAIATYASYARKDTRTPLVSMMLQAVVCISLAAIALAVHGKAVLITLGLAYSTSVVVAALHLNLVVRRGASRSGGQSRVAVIRICCAAILMIGPAWLAARVVPHWVGPPLGPRLAIILAALAGIGVYVGAQAAMRAPELSWLGAGMRHLRARASAIGASDG
ncbi:MAG: lipid II flippase MurJ [Jatrophihabitantaceae bacterium]